MVKSSVTEEKLKKAVVTGMTEMEHAGK